MKKALVATVVALTALSGCVNPVAQRNPPAASPIPQPTPLDQTARSAARDVVNREMARKLPGKNVAPYTDCIINNASASEITTLAGIGLGQGSAIEPVAAIIRRPETSQCIARVATV